MTTNNHPAHGPVSLDRLHQIRQYIERNNQYQNGGNLAYILTDMLKVIDDALEARNAEPVEFLPDNLDRALTILGVALPISKEEFNLDAERWMQRLINRVIRLESELIPPAPVVPEWTNEQCLEFMSIAFRHAEIKGDLELDDIRLGMKMVNESRAAMLQSFGNSEQLIKHQSSIQASDVMGSGYESKKPSSNEPVTLIKPVADLYSITSPTGSETTFTFDAGEASGFAKGGWAVQEYVELERYQQAIAGNSPVTPDGWAMVPKKLTAENGAKGVLSGEFSETKFINCPECFGDGECETCDGSGRIEITVPVTWTTIKAIWAKGVEHFTAAPQQEAKLCK